MVMLVLISQPEPSGQSLRPREVGMTLRTLSDAASRPALGDLWPFAAVFGDAEGASSTPRSRSYLTLSPPDSRFDPARSE